MYIHTWYDQPLFKFPPRSKICTYFLANELHDYLVYFHVPFKVYFLLKYLFLLWITQNVLDEFVVNKCVSKRGVPRCEHYVEVKTNTTRKELIDDDFEVYNIIFHISCLFEIYIIFCYNSETRTAFVVQYLPIINYSLSYK